MQIMKKLKGELISLCNKILFIALILFTTIIYSCKENSITQNTERKKSILSQQNSLDKQDFIKCTNVNDSSFSNNFHIRYISLDNSNYTIEVKTDNTIDTLDFYLSCKTPNGMIPKLLLETNFICFLQGSTSYRYLTLCSLDKNKSNLNINKFETARDISSKRDGYIFIHKDNLFFYDRNKEKLISKKISKKSLEIKYSELFDGNKILIKDEEGNIFKYSLNEFY